MLHSLCITVDILDNSGHTPLKSTGTRVPHLNIETPRNSPHNVNYPESYMVWLRYD